MLLKQKLQEKFIPSSVAATTAAKYVSMTSHAKPLHVKSGDRSSEIQEDNGILAFAHAPIFHRAF